MPRPDRNPWTPEQIALLRRLREQGCALERIAKMTGHSPQSCQTKASLLGLYRHRPIGVAGAVWAKNTRPCLRCRAPFRSEGPHHRMCASCRALSANPFEP